MNQRRQLLEALVSYCTVFVLVINAVIPSVTPAKASQAQPDSIKQSSPNGTLPLQTAVKYTPPPINRPTRTDPTPDEPEPIVPTKNQIEFDLTADSAILDSNGQITLKALIRNNSSNEVDNLTFTDPLETGLQYVSGSTSSLVYDSSKKVLSLSIPKLGAGEEFSFNYVISLTSAKRSSVIGKLWLHLAQLDSTQGNIHLKANTPFGSGLSIGNTKSSIAQFNPDGGWNNLGRFSIYMTTDSIDQDSALVASPTAIPGKGPALQFKLDVAKTPKLSKDAQGKLANQTISLGQVSNGTFKRPAFLEIKLDGYIDLNHIPAGQELYVATYDETHKVWIKVPILATDRKGNKVTVQANHFSTWGAGLGSSVPQDGANILLFDSHYTNLFTGAARYSIPIWTPKGRAGMSPDISLSYSSTTVDGLLGNVQAPWVGEGWNIDGVEIVRKITTSDTGYGYVDNANDQNPGYTLTINGATYNLLVDPLEPNRYFSREGAFLYIERHNDALGNGKDSNNNSSPNTTGEWWEVVTTDGTRYRLGWNQDSEQLALMYGYSCTTGNPCTTPDGAYASLGYAGKAENLVALRWRVDKVIDANKNYMTYSYSEEQPDSQIVPQFDRASYLLNITYTGHIDSLHHEDGANPGYKVKFISGLRTDDSVPQAFNLWDNYDTNRLDEIDICYENDESETIVRKYVLGYTSANVPDPNGTLILSSLNISGGDFTHPLTLTKAPTIGFTYTNFDNRAVTGNNNKYPYPRLTQINNGYGGSLSYTYQNDGRGTNDWYDWRVKNVDVESGVGTAAQKFYSYATPVYAGANNTGELIGYTDVTETTQDFNNGLVPLAITKHHFGTVGLDIGYELSTSWEDGSQLVLKKTDNVYVTDNSEAPFSGWNYRYLYQVTNYTRSGSALAQISQTQDVNDPGTGNLAEHDEYNGSTLLRKAYYEYWPNFNKDFYILDKPIRQVTVNASNTIFADTRYGYDGIADFRNSADPVIRKGNLTLTQNVIDESDATSDITYAYDDYGNQTSASAYKSAGSPGDEPAGDYETTSATFDDTLHTYPIKSTNALGVPKGTTNIAYLYSMGLPYQVTDPNGWVTTTSYDGLGRTLSVMPDGLFDGNNNPVAGVIYTYTAPDGNGNVAAPYSVQMRIWDPTFGSTGDYRNVWGIYDGLSRMLQTQTRDEDHSNLLVSDNIYNAQGLTSAQSSPYYASGSGGTLVSGATQYTTITYDALGRAIQVTSPGVINSYTSYDGLTVTATDPNGNKTARTSDGLGRLTMVQEFNGNNVYATTRFSYDIANRLIGTTDAQGNATILTYDLLGHKLTMTDPDMGHWQYQYDALGNLVQQTDARNQVLAFKYDGLNRLIEKDDSTNNVVLASYTYDVTGEIGARSTMSDQSGSTEWTYSTFGRTVEEKRTIGTVTDQSSTTTSDWLGRVLTITYPDPDPLHPEQLTYQYDALGRAKNFSSNQQTGGDLADLAYNTLSQLTTMSLKNGVAVTNTYDSNTNRLSERSAALNGPKLIDFSYLYDQAGNITTMNDNILSENQTFQYDPLNRLISATNVSGTDFRYRQSYQYDKVGNIQQVANWQTGDVIFKDDFETASLNTWSGTIQGGPRSPDLWTMNGSAFTPVSGQNALLVEVNDNVDAYVKDTSLNHEPSYRARFYFHPNHILMASNDSMTLFTGRTANANVMKLLLRFSNGVYQVSTSFTDNSGNWHSSAWYTVGNLWNSLEIDWETGTNGNLSFWLNGVFKETVGPYDNSTQQLVEARLGALDVNIAAVGQSQYDQIFFDAFESRRLTYIGLLSSQNAYLGRYQAVAYHEPASLVPSSGISNMPLDDLATDTDTPIPSDTPTATLPPTITLTPSQTIVPSPTDTMTFTSTSTPLTRTSTPIPSKTPTPSKTSTSIYTMTVSNTPTASNTVTSTYTTTATNTATPTITKTPSNTPIGTLTPPSPTNTPTSTNTPGPSPTVTSFLPAYWPFDDAGPTPIIRDIGAGTPSNGSASTGVQLVPGFHVNALQFISSGHYVNIPRKAELEPANGFTLSGWIYPTYPPRDPSGTPPGSTYVILNKGGASQDYRLYINSNGFLVFHVNDLTPAEVLGPIPPRFTWTHIAAVYDPAAKLIKLYVNGKLVASKQVTGSIVYDTSGPLTISDTTNPFIGMVDEIALYSGVLPDNQIKTLADLIVTGTPKPTNIATSTNTATPYTNSPTPSKTLTPTPTITSTPTTSTLDAQWGTGADGNLVIESTATATATPYNINTMNTGSRTCADGGDAVAYRVTSLGNTEAILSTTPQPGCLNTGDEILLINIQGTTTSTYNTGAYEFLHIGTINGSTLTFTTSKVNWYGDNWRSDTGIGTTAGKQNVMLIRVPNYNNVTVNGTLTGTAWTGTSYGLMAFRVAGTLSGTGMIKMDGFGYLGGIGGPGKTAHGSPGESYAGTGTQEPPYSNLGGGGGATPPKNGGGGGYATAGSISGGGGYGQGGSTYGESTLSKLYMGSGGGGGGASDAWDSHGGNGGRGGGIVFIAGSQIDFTGQILANGGNGTAGWSERDTAGNGGGGAGGSIRIVGGTINLNTMEAKGATDYTAAGRGRIAIYYQTSLSSGLNSDPTAFTAQNGAVPTPTDLPTPVIFETGPYGTGNDGDLTISNGSTFNISTQYSGSRSCADGIAYSVIELNPSYAKLSSNPASNCLAAGDEILLINLQGTTNLTVNTGNYEFLRIGGIINDTAYFTTSKLKFYGDNANDDSNIGTATTDQRVMLMRVPNYNNVTVNGNGILTGKAWTGTSYGLMAFRVADRLSGTGTIQMNTTGYRGGAGGSGTTHGEPGESYAGPTDSVTSANYGGGGGGLPGRYGGGGGYATAGTRGNGPGGYGGGMYGEATLNKLYLGSGGGGGGGSGNNPDSAGGNGGRGGGIILIAGNQVNFTGNIVASGAAGGVGYSSGDAQGRGGGGSGGSIRIEGGTINLNDVQAVGTTTYTSSGRGRIAVYYATSFTGSITPLYLQKQDSPDSIFQDDLETGDLSQWASSATDNGDLSASPALSYWGTDGLQAVINDNNALYVKDDKTIDDKTINETQYRARFYINPMGVTMAGSDTLEVFDGYNGSTNVFRVRMQEVGGLYKISTGIKNGSNWNDTGWYAITTNWNAVEISYNALANDGAITLWINDVSQESISHIDNATQTVTEVRLGAQNIQVGTRGTLYFDNFESRRFSYIGILPPPDLPNPQPASQAGWTATNYTYDANHAHAATSAGGNSYTYDANGNMTCRVENSINYMQVYNSENRLATVKKLSAGTCAAIDKIDTQWDFTYDGDGSRVKQVVSTYDPNTQSITGVSVTAYFIGGLYQVTDSAVTKYYAIAGMTIAMNDGNGMKYLLTDHLGSVVAVTDASGSILSQQRYLPFGQVRTDVGTVTQTDFGYTGQRNDSYLNLSDYKFRSYSDQLGRFISPDDIIPDLTNPQALNRYSYAFNRPIILNDPSGHCPICIVAVLLIAVLLSGDTPRLGAGDAGNVLDLVAAGLQHDKHANIVNEGLKSLQDDPSVQAAQDRITNSITSNPKYREQSYSLGDISDQFTANGPSGNWKQAAITGNQAFWMVHTGSISATNIKVSADGTISTTWHIHDDFDFIPGLNHSDVYNNLAKPVHSIYNDKLHAEESYPTDAHWNQTISPSNSCGNCR